MVDAAAISSSDFDLFVLHAAADTGFVCSYLLRAIGFDEADPRVMLPSKYELGRPTLAEVERAVRRSRYTVLVVSNASRADGWTQLGSLLAGTLGATGSYRLVPLRLDDGPLDLAIGYLEALRFADRADWDAQTARLRRLLERPTPIGVRIDCPYPGLAAFQQRDSGRFFGRDKQVHELVRRVEDGARMLCVIGPSGSGKSSLVQAGVLAWLDRDSARRDRFAVRTMRPAADPVAQLARALDGNDRTAIADLVGTLLDRNARTRIALFVDHLEELFTLADADERSRFVAALHALRDDARCCVIAALRADFYGSLMESDLWPDFEYGRCEVVPLRGKDLRDAIVLPAANVGVALDAELVGRLAADTAAEPGALPLLQATLVELWGVFEGRTAAPAMNRYLTLADYEQLGGDGHTGIATALARSADAALADLTPSRREIARRVLLSLVCFGEGRMHTRRQQRTAALREREDPAEFATTLRVLVDRRLVTTGSGPSGATIDLSHEALLTAWPALRSWIATHRADEEHKRALAVKVAEWKAARHSGFRDAKLLDAVELPDAERYLEHSATHAGLVPELEKLVEHSRVELEAIRRERDDAHRLLALSYQERGRQLLLEGRPMSALPYLHAARKIADTTGPHAVNRSLQMLFAQAASALPVATLTHSASLDRAVFSPDGNRIATASRDHTAVIWDAASAVAVLPPLRHDDAVLDVAFSPDGARIITASADHRARVWSLASGEQMMPPLEHGAKVHLACFSSDGKAILTACWGRTARIWHAASGTPISPPITHGGKITCASFSPDDRRVVIAGGHRVARVCDATTGELVFELAHTDIVRAAAFSPDGSRIITASADRTAQLWDATTGAALNPFEHSASVAHAEFGVGGARVLTTSHDATRIWNAASGTVVSEVRPSGSHVECAALSADGMYVVTACFDHTIRITDAASGRPLAPPFEDAREALRVAIDRAGHRIVAVVADGTARVWDAERARSRSVPLAHSRGWLTSVAFDRDGTRLVTAGKDRTARLWHTATGASLGPALHHDHDVIAAMFTPDGARVVTVGARMATLWNAGTGERVRVFEHAKAVSTAAVSPEGASLATAGRDGDLKVWDMRRGALEPFHIYSHGAPVTGAWFSPDGACLASACADGYLRLWRDGCAPCVRRAHAVDAAVRHDGHTCCFQHDGTVTHAAFDRHGARIATASRDRTARVWDVDGSSISPPLQHAEEVRRVAFSPDGSRVVTTSGTMVRVWDAVSGRLVLDPLGHPGPVRAARFSSDGALLATASEDGKARLWDAATGRLISPPLAHPRRVNDLAFSPDGAYLATASGDPIARIWKLASDDHSLAECSELVSRCPYEFVDEVLVERHVGLSR